MKKLMIVLVALILPIITSEVVTEAKTVMTSPELQVSAKDVDTFKITWNKTNKADGYVLSYSTNGKSYKKLVQTKKTAYTHTGLEEGEKYYYKVRSYKKENGKIIYSKYSKVLARRCTNYLVEMYSPYRVYNKWTTTGIYREYKPGSTFQMGGKEFSNGFVLSGGIRSSQDMSAFFNLDGKYRSISFTYACVDARAQDSKIKIYSDDECAMEIEIGESDLPKTVTVDIQNASKLEIAAYGYEIGFADVKLHK